MDNGRCSVGAILCFSFVLISSSSAEFLIQQVTESQVSSVSQTEYNSSYNFNTNLGVTSVLRDEGPSSKIVTIESFSVVKSRYEPYESSVFEASGYKWRLIMYANGNRGDGGKDHVSLYVRIEDIGSFPKGWNVNVDLKLFVHNPKQRKYLTVTDGTVKRYDEAKKEWGFGQLIPLSTFYEPNEGYIVQDTCSFGAEIFIVKPVEQKEKVTFVPNPPNNVFTWRIQRVSSLRDKIYFSNSFLVGNRYWALGSNPRGSGDGRQHGVPIYLYSRGFKPNAVATSTWGEVNLRLMQQVGTNHKKAHAAAWYPVRSGRGVGVNSIIPRKDLEAGYLVNDSIVFEAEITMVSVTNIVPAV